MRRGRRTAAAASGSRRHRPFMQQFWPATHPAGRQAARQQQQTGQPQRRGRRPVRARVGAKMAARRPSRAGVTARAHHAPAVSMPLRNSGMDRNRKTAPAPPQLPTVGGRRIPGPPSHPGRKTGPVALRPPGPSTAAGAHRRPLRPPLAGLPRAPPPRRGKAATGRLYDAPPRRGRRLFYPRACSWTAPAGCRGAAWTRGHRREILDRLAAL